MHTVCRYLCAYRLPLSLAVSVYQVDLEKPDKNLHSAALEEGRFLEVHSVTLTSPLYPEPLYKPYTPPGICASVFISLDVSCEGKEIGCETAE